MKFAILLLGEGNFSFARQLSEALTPSIFVHSQSSSSSSNSLSAVDSIEKIIIKNKSECAIHPNENHREEHKENPDKVKLKNSEKWPITLIASDFKVKNSQEEENELKNDKKVCDNVLILRQKKNVHVLLDVDSCKLEQNSRLKEILKPINGESYDILKVVFNYPHVQNVKMKINLNRQLLRETFQSLERLSKMIQVKKIQVFITLCYGQSGLNIVEPYTKHRVWSDSWQLPEMAAYGNFGLVNVFQFGKLLIDELISEHTQPEVCSKRFELNNRMLNCNSEDDDVDDEDSGGVIPVGENCNTNIKYESFGYRNRNISFNLNARGKTFLGGNVFVFQYRPEEFQFSTQKFSSIYHEILHDPNNSEHSISTYGLLFPQTFYRDVSFKVHLNIQTYDSSSIIDYQTLLFNQITQLLCDFLKNIQFLEVYQLSKTVRSYLFRLQLCSESLPMNSEKVNQIILKLQQTICDNHQNIQYK